MSKRHFSWLLGLTLFVTGIILLFPAKTGKNIAFDVRPLVPGLESQINEVRRVKIVKAGNVPVATLLRQEQGWVVEEAQFYPADWAKLKALLAALAQAEIIELKTSNPEYFDRLAVTDIGNESSQAVLVELSYADEIVAVLIGSAAQGRNGQYVRIENGDQALLVDQTLDVPGDSSAWLETEIIDLAVTEIVEVVVTHPDGETISAVKISADDQDFNLLKIPEGREIQSNWAVNSLGGILAGLTLEEARQDSELDWSDAIGLKLLTADGLEVMADLKKVDEKNWMRLTASTYPMGNTPQETAEANSKQENIEISAGNDRLARAEEINQRVNGWAYVISDLKSEAMNKRLEDLLKPLAEE
jgi:hypothetical protein